MDVPTELITGAVLAAGGLLLGNTGSLIRLHQKVGDHIKKEDEDRKTLDELQARLVRVEKKMPNGEIELIYSMVKALYEDADPTLDPDIEKRELELQRELLRLKKVEDDELR